MKNKKPEAPAALAPVPAPVSIVSKSKKVAELLHVTVTAAGGKKRMPLQHSTCC